MKITNYKQAVGYLDSLIKPVVFAGITKEQAKLHDPLERMRVLLSLLGNPQDKFPAVLVGGTSGKGSTAYLISHILKTAGYKTGFTLSPHLERVNERMQINARSIDDKTFTNLVASLIQAIESMSKMEAGEPSHFEVLIAMAFLYFVQQKIDIAVVEVGLGGKYDATNTLNPLIAVLTNVSLDHTAILGNTVEKIVREKAGIIKQVQHDKMDKTSIVVTGVRQKSVVEIVEKRCKKTEAVLSRLNKNFSHKIKKEDVNGSIFDFKSGELKSSYENIALAMLGEYQVENASLAIETVLQLRKFGFRINEKDIKNALKNSFFPGRFEIFRLTSFAQDKTSSTLVLDGAHNPAKMQAFIKSLNQIFPNHKKIFIVGFKSDKNIKQMLRYILPSADAIIATEFQTKTYYKGANSAVSAESIMYQILSFSPEPKSRDIKYKKKIRVFVEKDSKKALEKAFEMLKSIQQVFDSEAQIFDSEITQIRGTRGAQNRQVQHGKRIGTIVVTGSLYLVGEIKNLLE